MANVQIKSEKLTPFGGIFPIMEQFDALLAQTIDSTLGMRCKWYGYQYSEILRGENGAFPPTRDGCIHSLSMRERG